MADDIDDLLDEVENKYCDKKNADFVSKNIKSRTISEHKKRLKSKIDNDIDDLLELDIPDSSIKDSISQKNINLVRSAKKCLPIYVGGTSYDKGFGSSVNKRICDCLRCTSCDFKVVIFSDYEWNTKTDYLFLRNNAPDFKKLKSNLKRKKGSNAYNCQCSWKTFTDLTELKDPNLKWVCSKH